MAQHFNDRGRISNAAIAISTVVVATHMTDHAPMLHPGRVSFGQRGDVRGIELLETFVVSLEPDLAARVVEAKLAGTVMGISFPGLVSSTLQRFGCMSSPTLRLL